ncbi:histidine kinase [uncultured Paludibaculum sp.]|uniref:histidine kinase n=1 Tax=uncultured Paludibaculum sp. TaxID=1765020 RepID=UPI002AAA92FF|nr:histidine kinase [uncultured Paludibaculum sp.]
MSRRLHDDIGPSLCSAGLMVGLLRSSCTDLDPGHREMLDAVQEALESAVDSVRLLSYQSAPDIERRCGLRKSVELISQGRPVDVTFAAGDPVWTGEQAEGVCRIIGDTLLAWDASARPGRLDIVLEPGAAHLRAPAGGLLTEATLEAVRMIAAWNGLSIDYRDASVSELSVTPGKERQ